MGPAAAPPSRTLHGVGIELLLVPSLLEEPPDTTPIALAGVGSKAAHLHRRLHLLSLYSTRSRLKKRSALAACLGAMSEEELPIDVAYLVGSLPQGKIGVR